MKNGFHINECGTCVYIEQTYQLVVIVCLYVDDMLIVETNIEIINYTTNMSSSNFDMLQMLSWYEDNKNISRNRAISIILCGVGV